MRTVFFSLIAIIFCGCMGSKMASGDRLGYQIMGNFAKEKKKQGLDGVGFGGGGTKEKWDHLNLQFSCDQVLTIDSARKLIVETVNDFVVFINSHENFKDQMIVYPFTEKNVCVIISGESPIEKERSVVEFVAADEGCVRYFSDTDDPKNALIHKETFQEAVRILNEK